MADFNVCEFGHDTHATMRAGDWTIYDWQQYWDLPPGYCPGRDDVSQSIELYGEWEPDETALALSVVRPNDVVVDFGAHIGWYAAQAAQKGATVIAYDSDPENMRLLEQNAPDRGGIIPLLLPLADAEELPPFPIRLVKADVEGAEDQAMRIITPSLDAGLVDHLLIECSPEFGDYYPALVDGLIARGYTAEAIGAGPVTGATLGPTQQNLWFERATP